VISVESIEAWRGKRVVDPDDEELGKLEDVFFDTGSGTPLLVSVKSGLLGRKTKLVPIDDATVGPDHVRVAHRRETFEQAADMRGAESPGSEDLAAIGQTYGLRFSDRVSLESAQMRDAHRAEAQAARQRAEQLEAQAREKIAAHEAARAQARTAGADAGAAEREAEEARRAALEAREQADRYGTA
jgi:hypothetical protein